MRHGDVRPCQYVFGGRETQLFFAQALMTNNSLMSLMSREMNSAVAILLYENSRLSSYIPGQIVRTEKIAVFPNIQGNLNN